MAGTVPDLVRAVIGRTGLPKVFVEQRARALQDAGLLPVGVGRRVEAARPRDLARLLLALSADKVRKAPATVQLYSELATVNTGEPAGAAVESLVADIWSGDRERRGDVLTITTSEPLLTIAARDTPGRRYWPPGSYVDLPHADALRRFLAIPGMVIAAIGADLGQRGCRDAG